MYCDRNATDSAGCARSPTTTSLCVVRRLLSFVVKSRRSFSLQSTQRDAREPGTGSGLSNHASNIVCQSHRIRVLMRAHKNATNSALHKSRALCHFLGLCRMYDYSLWIYLRRLVFVGLVSDIFSRESSKLWTTTRKTTDFDVKLDSFWGIIGRNNESRSKVDRWRTLAGVVVRRCE